MSETGKLEPVLVRLDSVDAILLRPFEDDEPGILFWLTDGTTLFHVTSTESECDEMWANVEKKLLNDDFIRYHNVMFRAESLQNIDAKNTPQSGNCICFKLRQGREFIHRYEDHLQQNKDLEELTAILSTLQDIRASRYAPSVKQ